PEIEDLDAPVVRRENVLGLEIAVNDPFLMSSREPVRDLDRVLDRLAGREAAARELLAQRLSLEELLDDVGRAFVGPDVVDGGDVGMVQNACGPGLLLEAPQAVRVQRKRRGQDLDRDVPA